MDPLDSMDRIFLETLPWHKARVKFFVRFVVALIAVKTVDLGEIAAAFAGKATLDSKYRRVRRFFADFDLTHADVADLVVRLVGVPKPWTLAMDRTNWKLGAVEINVLTVGIVHDGIAWPVVWWPLGRAGNSHTGERIAILEVFVDLFGADAVRRLLADREFVGAAWFEWLKKNGIDFRIRIKRDSRIADSRGRLREAGGLFADLRVGEVRVLSGPRRMWGGTWRFSGARLPGGEFLIVASPGEAPEAVGDYRERWGIETLFGALKTRGFRLEDTRLADPDRLSKLIALAAVAFCWSQKLGGRLDAASPLKLKKHGRKPKSTFRRGFDRLRELILAFDRFDEVGWNQALKVLSGT